MVSREMYTICRLCLRESQHLTNIFEVKVNHSNVLGEVIADLLQYPVFVNDGYPQHVCPKCSDKLIEFTTFKEQCLKSRVSFDNLFAPRKLPSEEELRKLGTSQATMKTEPDPTPDEDIEVQIDCHPDTLVKREIVADDSPNKMSPPTVKGEPDLTSNNGDVEIQPNPETEIAEQRRLDNSRETKCVYDRISILGHAIQSRMIDVQTLAGRSNSCCSLDAQHPLKLVQPNLGTETAEQRTFGHSGEEGFAYRWRCSSKQDLQSRSVEGQSLAGGSSGSYGLNDQHPVEMWQPISETSEERRRRLTREHMRKVRANLTPEQIVERRIVDSRRAAIKRQNETPLERERRRYLVAYRMARKRLSETPEERAERRRLDKIRHASRRQSLTMG